MKVISLQIAYPDLYAGQLLSFSNCPLDDVEVLEYKHKLMKCELFPFVTYL